MAIMPKKKSIDVISAAASTRAMTIHHNQSGMA